MSENDDYSSSPPNRWFSPLAVGAYFVILKLCLHFAFNSSYDFFRDELYYIACSEHLALGYPDHAPLIAFATRLSRALFGESLFAFRLLPALAGGAKIFLAALLVKEFGGRGFAAFLACLCVLCAPVYLAIDNLLAMNAFEPVFWMACVYFAVLAVKREQPRYWLWFGFFAGLGLMNKHSMLFFGAAIVIGLIATPARKYLLDKWLWLGGAIAFLIFLPNIVWQIQNDFATLELLRNVQKTGKNVVVAPHEFIIQQIFALNPASILVWLPGLWYFLFDKRGREFRFLGVAYLVLLAMMIYLGAKDYYLAPIYPMLFAAGAVWWEQISEKIRALYFSRFLLPLPILAFFGVALPFVVPVLPIEKFIQYQEMTGIKPPKSEVSFDSVLPQIYADQFGWREMTEKVAQVYNALPPEEQAKAGIYASNYGQAGAIDFYGGKYGLPKSISPHQSYFVWGPRDYTGEVLILLGSSRESAEKNCNRVEEAAAVSHPYTMSYENYKILVCRDAKKPLPEIWSSLKYWN